MIYSVRGKLIHTENSAAVVECGGVGYLCQTTMNTLKTLKLIPTLMCVKMQSICSDLQLKTNLQPLKHL